MNGDNHVEIVRRPATVKASEFQRFCGQVAALLGVDGRFVPRVAAFLLNLNRLPVVWFQFTSCDGCKDSFLQSPLPWAGHTLFAQLPSCAAGERDPRPQRSGGARDLVETLRSHAGRYVCVVEGAPPPALRGSPGIGRMMEVAAQVCSNARAVLCVGSCTATTALAAGPGAPLTDASGLPAVHVPGCPPSPLLLAATLVARLATGVGAPEPFAPGELVPDRLRLPPEMPPRRDRGGIVEPDPVPLCAACP